MVNKIKRFPHQKRKIAKYCPNRKRTMFFTFCILIVMLIVALCLDARIRPAVREGAAYKMEEEATLAITRAVERELLHSDLQYEDIVHITYNTNGEVSSLSTDIIKLNVLRSRVTQAANEAVWAMDGKLVSVNTGNMTGFTALTGRGPNLKVRLSINGNVTSEFENVFETAGVNQTEHRLMINVTAKTVMGVDGTSIEKKITVCICAAQTVIVGTVPNVNMGSYNIK